MCPFFIMAKMGRPTKYDSSFVDEIDSYLETTGREQTELPTIEGFAKYLDVTSETLRQWEKEYPDFSLTIKKLEERQKNQLMNDGLYGGKEVNSVMAIFLLKVNHGMVETSRQEMVGKDGQPLQLFINAGQGFLPASVEVFTPSNQGYAGGQSQVQSSSVAQTGQEDDNSDNGSSQAGTP